MEERIFTVRAWGRGEEVFGRHTKATIDLFSLPVFQLIVCVMLQSFTLIEATLGNAEWDASDIP